MTINEAANRLEKSYSAVYSVVRELNLGEKLGSRWMISEEDMAVVEEQLYLRRRRSTLYEVRDDIQAIRKELEKIKELLNDQRTAQIN